jgi:tetratricopeptide (TPR) repeat protein
MHRAEDEVQRASKELEEQLALWESTKKDYQHRLIQAHLVKGAISAARAAAKRKKGTDDREDNQAALTDFERAMKVDPTQPDPMALEFAAHQRVRLGDYTGAFEDLARLAQWAETAGKPVVRARALKFQAEIHECRNEDQPNVHAATQLLNTAIQIFPTPLSHSEIVEAAELHEVQGRVRSKRPSSDWDDAALNSYTNAEGLYHQISSPVAAAGLKRIANERAKILARRHQRPNASNGSASPAPPSP